MADRSTINSKENQPKPLTFSIDEKDSSQFRRSSSIQESLRKLGRNDQDPVRKLGLIRGPLKNIDVNDGGSIEVASSSIRKELETVKLSEEEEEKSNPFRETRVRVPLLGSRSNGQKFDSLAKLSEKVAGSSRSWALADAEGAKLRSTIELLKSYGGFLYGKERLEPFQLLKETRVDRKSNIPSKSAKMFTPPVKRWRKPVFSYKIPLKTSSKQGKERLEPFQLLRETKVDKKSDIPSKSAKMFTPPVKKWRKPVFSYRIPLKTSSKQVAGSSENNTPTNYSVQCRKSVSFRGVSYSKNLNNNDSSPSLSYKQGATTSKEKVSKERDSLPRLWVYNNAFADNEIFDPYTMSVTLHDLFFEGKIIVAPEIIFASYGDWLLAASDINNEPHFYKPSTGVIEPLPLPENGFPQDFFAGTFTRSACEGYNVVLVRSEGERLQVWVYQDGADEWHVVVVDEVDEGINSPVIHQSRLWWTGDNGGIYCLEYDNPGEVLMSSWEGDSSHAPVLVPCNQKLYNVVLYAHPHAAEWVVMRIDEESEGLSFYGTDDLEGYNFFVIPKRMGIARLGPEHVRNIIFIAIPEEMGGVVDCTQFSTVGRQHFEIKDCREGAEHEQCRLFWLA